MALMTDSFNVLLALIVVSAATFVIVVSVAVVSSSLLSPNMVYIFCILVLGSVSHLARRVAQLHRQYTTRVCSANEGLEGRVCFGSDCLPIIEFLQWKDACLHQQTEGVVDDLCVQVRVTCEDLYLLAFLDPV